MASEQAEGGVQPLEPSQATPDASLPGDASTPSAADLDAGTGETLSGEPEPEPDSSSDIEPLASIDGRWGMAGFADPVGIQIVEVDGAFSGEGCAAGAPPVELGLRSFCGPLTGTRRAREATFGFLFESYSYLAEVTVSEDGQRMTGRFHGASGFLDTPTAWLRVESEATWLPQAPTDAPVGVYELSVIESATSGEDYAPGESYSLQLSRERGIWGHLGSFWWSEASVTAEAISIGPVAATAPELPIQVEIQLQAGVPTGVQAVTAAGNEYSFEVLSP